MKKNRFLIQLVFISISVQFCSCVAINSSFQSAKLLDKGAIEITPSASEYYNVNNIDGGTETRNIGGTIGYGLSSKFNLRLKYEHIGLGQDDINSHYLAITPKISLKDSFKAPASL